MRHLDFIANNAIENDTLIYMLYGLTDDEIKIVEEK